MRIGIISHSPLWTTGFGVTCNRIANSMVKFGHEVSCLGIGEGNNLFEGYPFKIYQVDWPRAYNGVSNFINEESPDIILINFDINAAGYFIKFCRLLNFKGMIFAHIVLDGTPVYEELLSPVRDIDGVIVPTRSSQKYLRSEGIKNVYYAPHGVDRKEFIPLKNKKEIRLKLGLKSALNKTFIIGVFAKNEERKQIPKILLALHYLVYTLKEKKILLYLHTQAKPDLNKGWDLEHLVNRLKLSQNVIFTAKNFKQDMGINRKYDISNQPHDTKQLSYVERINMCDLIINIPFSGGFELCNIEAQACGIPLITVDDSGNIKEVVDELASLIKPAMKNIWGNGAWIYLVDEMELAQSILYIKNNQAYKDELIQKGIQNARRFSWIKLERAVQKMIMTKHPVPVTINHVFES